MLNAQLSNQVVCITHLIIQYDIHVLSDHNIRDDFVVKVSASRKKKLGIASHSKAVLGKNILYYANFEAM